MADNEFYSPDSLAGLPRVTPAVIKAYNEQPHDLEHELTTLKRENPDIARELMVHAELDAKDIEKKRAFAQGALFMYSLLSLNAEAQRLEALFSLNVSDDDADEDQLPST